METLLQHRSLPGPWGTPCTAPRAVGPPCWQGCTGCLEKPRVVSSLCSPSLRWRHSSRGPSSCTHRSQADFQPELRALAPLLQASGHTCWHTVSRTSHTDNTALRRARGADTFQARQKKQCLPLNQERKEKVPLKWRKHGNDYKKPDRILHAAADPVTITSTTLSACVYLSRLPAGHSKANALNISR